MENKNVYSVQFGRNGTDKGDGFYYPKKEAEIRFFKQLWLAKTNQQGGKNHVKLKKWKRADWRWTA